MSQELPSADEQLYDDEYCYIKTSFQNEQIDYEYEYDQEDEKLPDEEREYQKVKDLPNPIDSEKTLKEIEEIIIQIQKIFQMDRDNAIEILMYNNWNIEQIQIDFNNNKETYLIQQNQYRKLFNHKIISYPNHNDIQKFCYECQEEQPQIILGCLHNCCQECLKNKINIFLEQRQIKISCLNQSCKYKLPYSMIYKLMDDKTKVQNCLLKEFGFNTPFYMYCSLCDTVLQQFDQSQLKALCKCRSEYCFMCKAENHFPVSCDERREQLQLKRHFPNEFQADSQELNQTKFKYDFKVFRKKYEVFQEKCENLSNQHPYSQLQNSLLQIYIELKNCFQSMQWATCFNSNQFLQYPNNAKLLDEKIIYFRNLCKDTEIKVKQVLEFSLNKEKKDCFHHIEVLKTLQTKLFIVRIQFEKL